MASPADSARRRAAHEPARDAGSGSLDDDPCTVSPWNTPSPTRWVVYAAALSVLSVPFYARGFLALRDTPADPVFLLLLGLTLVIGNACILNMSPYRHLHLGTGIVVLSAFFIVGPAVLALVALSIKPSNWLSRWSAGLFDLTPGPQPARPWVRYVVPSAALGIALGTLDALRGSIGLGYPMPMASVSSLIQFYLLLAAAVAGFVLLTEIGFHLRFGDLVGIGVKQTRRDLLAYVAMAGLAAPVVVGIVMAYRPTFPGALLTIGGMLWGLGVFRIASVLVQRRLAIGQLRLTVARQERFAALGRLTSVIAHQTRHHLGVLNLSAHVLEATLASEPLSPQAREAVRIELEAIARTRDELDRLLVQEMRGETAVDRFALMALARECGHELARVADQRAIVIRCGQDDALIRGDRLRLKQAIANLVRNAIEAAPARSAVVIDLTTDDASVCLHVRDHGPGLSEAARAHLFDPFFTEKQDGAGMGLYVAKVIVQAHRGSLALESNGDGTDAQLRLPRDMVAA